jgi:hypothetical protein
MSNSEGPSRRVFTVTPSDSINFSRIVRQLYVGVGGNIVVVNNDNSTTTFVNVIQGTIIGPFNIVRVNNTNTTASSLVAFE